MSEHINRKKEIFRDALPLRGTAAYKEVEAMHERMMAKKPELKKIYKQKLEQASKTVMIQDATGVGFPMDVEIRHFLREFNSRVFEQGLRTMPVLFNVMEAFFDYKRSLAFFEMLDEEDYLISFFDFLDYYTSKEFVDDIENAKENLQEDLIYHFNVGRDIDAITFKTESGAEFVIAGISIVRRKNEVTVMLLGGEITSTDQDVIDHEEKGEQIIPPGKEFIFQNREYEYKPVKLNDKDGLWKTIMMCRLDLDSDTIDGRYIAKDYGDKFSIITDDPNAYLAENSEIPEKFREGYENKLKELEHFNPLFEIAKAALYLPAYFNAFDEDITSENHETEYRKMVNNPTRRREFNCVDNKFKISSKDLFILNRGNKFAPDRVKINNSNFKIEKSGFWKKLAVDEFGIDKKGERIAAKTWVNRRDTYYEGNNDDLIVTNKKSRQFDGPNAGYIYVMRNPTFPDDTFKIGLTTKTTEERSDQLSKTSVADRFYVMAEWETANCKKAESEIHEILADFRVDERREFFTADMKLINETINKVVSVINKKDE